MAAIGFRRTRHCRKTSGANCRCGCGKLTTTVGFVFLSHHFASAPSPYFKRLLLPCFSSCSYHPVNVRLMGERLERNAEKEPNQWESQQARWPSLYACPNCWRDDRSWEDEEVFKFLRSSYWSGNPSYMKIPPPGDDGSVDGRSRMVPLRWKLAAVVFATVALILHMYNTKRRKQYSGKHKK